MWAKVNMVWKMQRRKSVVLLIWQDTCPRSREVSTRLLARCWFVDLIAPLLLLLLSLFSFSLQSLPTRRKSKQTNCTQANFDDRWWWWWCWTLPPPVSNRSNGEWKSMQVNFGWKKEEVKAEEAVVEDSRPGNDDESMNLSGFVLSVKLWMSFCR